MGFQRRSEKLNGVLLLGALGEDIPEGRGGGGGEEHTFYLHVIVIYLNVPGPPFVLGDRFC